MSEPIKPDNIIPRSWAAQSGDGPINTNHLMLQLAESVRLAAALAVLGPRDMLNRQGHYSSASTREVAAMEIQRINLHALIEQVSGAPLPVNENEQQAFDKAAWAASMNTAKHDGKFVYTQGRQASLIWQAAVRWQRGQSTQQDSENGVKT